MMNIKIITKQHYRDLQKCILNKSKTIEVLKTQNEVLQQMVKVRDDKLRAYRSLVDIDPIIFPNTDERGLGDSGTPDNIPDIWSL